MGSQAAQNQLWSRGADDWAAIQEGTVEDCYRYVLEYLPALKDKRVLDIGCGSGLFCHLAQTHGTIVTGMDASDGLIAAARKRNARVEFSVGEMERLPFDDETFDLVCGFNSFQFAANPLNAFAEARRVLKPGGTLVAMIWGEREDCEAATFLKALGGLMPSTMPPGAGPFALTSDRKLENLIGQAGFSIHHQVDRGNAWIYPDQDTALRGLLSAGPAAAAIAHSGEERVRTELRQSMQPFVKPDGRVIYRNKFRIVIAKK